MDGGCISQAPQKVFSRVLLEVLLPSFGVILRVTHHLKVCRPDVGGTQRRCIALARGAQYVVLIDPREAGDVEDLTWQEEGGTGVKIAIS